MAWTMTVGHMKSVVQVMKSMVHVMMRGVPKAWTMTEGHMKSVVQVMWDEPMAWTMTV